ncbi:MAG: hypothetical protein IAA85_05175 [Firmicutes bacterium]|nr:hypothetical protein [Candidatus Alectryobacillus merdavium]
MNKKYITTSDITFISLMSALVCVMSLILIFIPFSFLLMIIVYPLISSYVSYKSKIKVSLLFMLASILLSFIICFGDIGNVLFYIIPGLILGFSIGLMIKKTQQFFNIFVFSTIISFILFEISIPLINVIYSIDFIDSTLNLIAISASYSFIILFHLIIFIVNLMITFITIFFIYIVLKKVKIVLNFNFKTSISYKNICISLLFLIISIIFSFISEVSFLSYIFLICGTLLNVYPNIDYQRRLNMVFFIMSFIIGILLTIFLNLYFIDIFKAIMLSTIYLLLNSYLVISKLLRYNK